MIIDINYLLQSFDSVQKNESDYVIVRFPKISLTA
jgi:hypothetical protein